MRCVRLPWLLSVAASLFFSPPPAGAQQAPEASAKFLGGNRIALGEQGALMIQVSGVENVSPPEIQADGLQITYTDKAFDFQNRSIHMFYYHVVGDKAGTFTIPAIKVKVDNQELATLPLEVTIFAPDPGSDAANAALPRFLRLELLKKELYVGQLVPLTLTVYSRGENSINDVTSPVLKNDAFVVNRFTKVHLDGMELDGIPFSTATLPGSLFPLTAGEHTLGPAEVVARMIESSGRFGSLTGYYNDTRVHKLVSNSLQVKVYPLPEEGKPDTFRGAVGSFQLSATASPLDLKAGDPISIDFEVTGAGNLDSLVAPVFQPADDTQWRIYEARKIVDPSETSDGVTPGRATFTQIVMPQAEVTEIPSFELACFNPATGAYAVQRTQPIPIRVQSDPKRPDAGVAIPAIPGDPAGAGFPTAAQPVAQFNDILYIRTGSPLWRAMPAAITGRPLFWVAQALALVLFLGLIGLAIAKRARAAALSSSVLNPHPSFKQCLKRLGQAENRGAFFRTVESALAAWERERTPRPGPLPPAVTTGLISLRSRCKRVLHGGPLTEETQPVEPREAEEILGLLHRLGKTIG